MSAADSIADPDQLAIATIRTLCIDAVQQADSGHPGHADGGGERGVGPG